MGHVRDVTNDRTASVRSTLAESLRLFNDILESIQEELCVVDLNLRILFVNKYMADNYAHAGELTGRACYEAFHGRTQPCANCQVLHAILSKQMQMQAMAYSGTDKKQRWLEVYAHPMLNSEGQVIGVVEFVRDITEAQKAKQALVDSEQNLRNVFNGCCDAIIIHDDEGKILQANERMLLMFGCERQRLSTVTMQELWEKGLTEQKELPASDGVLQHGNRCSRFLETTAQRLDSGLLFPVEICISNIRYKGREAQMCTIRDITMRRKAEKVMVQNYRKLEREFREHNQRFAELTERICQEYQRSQTIFESVVSSKKHIVNLAGSYGSLLQKGDKTPNYLKLLSKREYQVFLLLAEGHRPKDIALQTDLDPRTVSGYIRRIREKLGVRSLGQIIKLAMEHGTG